MKKNVENLEDCTDKLVKQAIIALNEASRAKNNEDYKSALSKMRICLEFICKGIVFKKSDSHEEAIDLIDKCEALGDLLHQIASWKCKNWIRKPIKEDFYNLKDFGNIGSHTEDADEEDCKKGHDSFVKIIQFFYKEIDKPIPPKLKAAFGSICFFNYYDPHEKWDFSDRDLPKVDFSNMVFIDSKFDNATLLDTFFWNVQLQKATFKSTNLTNANFKLTNLRKCDFEKATLEKTIFMQVLLEEVDFSDANLCESHFWNKTLIDSCKFDKAKFYRARFEDIYIQNSNFDCAEMHTKQFRYYSAEHADFIRCKIYNCIFSNASLSMTRFIDSTIMYSNFSNAKIEKVNFSKATLEQNSFSRADGKSSDFSETIIKGISFEEANIPQANFCKAEILWEEIRPFTYQEKFCSFASIPYFNKATLKQADFSKARITAGCFNEADLTDAKFIGTIINNATPKYPRDGFLIEEGKEAEIIYILKSSFNNAVMDNADLSGCKIIGAEMKGVSLCNANLSNADLTDCDLSGANLSGANLIGCILKGVNFQNADLTKVILYNDLEIMLNVVSKYVEECSPNIENGVSIIPDSYTQTATTEQVKRILAQLKTVHSLHDTKGIEMWEKILKIESFDHLFEPPTNNKDADHNSDNNHAID